jgi:hypothetical protein
MRTARPATAKRSVDLFKRGRPKYNPTPIRYANPKPISIHPAAADSLSGSGDAASVGGAERGLTTSRVTNSGTVSFGDTWGLFGLSVNTGCMMSDMGGLDVAAGSTGSIEKIFFVISDTIFLHAVNYSALNQIFSCLLYQSHRHGESGEDQNNPRSGDWVDYDGLQEPRREGCAIY